MPASAKHFFSFTGKCMMISDVADSSAIYPHRHDIRSNKSYAIIERRREMRELYSGIWAHRDLFIRLRNMGIEQGKWNFLSHQSNISFINQFAQIIGEELIRNLSLEIMAVGIVTLVLLRNLLTSFWVMCCVLFTLIDLLGSMYFLGLTVEISSTIMILLCAGLAVDYAAHIGLEFIRSSGSKQGY